ncbi:flagellar assembly protein FliW [Paenibacillus sp. FSL K6-1566]|uniref:flagellar assembly protein FliW n=1 Tax=Paenibacillus TaxID=44249 RepID=UPI0020405A7C|nr:flagellar assembly protein FliW [Paenibacillus lactis]MCM3493478.1 flagellar assembly protein FliW [Paenibacillus lactis]
MIINTKRFGPIEFDEKQVITFVGPILGFKDLEKYTLIQSEGNRHPFEFLQSVEDEDLTFIVTSPFVFFKDYEFQLDSYWIDALEVQSDRDLTVMVIVTVRSKEEISCNLKAPIVMNQTKNIAAQIVLEQRRYTTKHPLLGGVKGEGSDVNPVSK